MKKILIMFHYVKLKHLFRKFFTTKQIEGSGKGVFDEITIMSFIVLLLALIL